MIKVLTALVLLFLCEFVSVLGECDSEDLQLIQCYVRFLFDICIDLTKNYI